MKTNKPIWILAQELEHKHKRHLARQYGPNPWVYVAIGFELLWLLMIVQKLI